MSSSHPPYVKMINMQKKVEIKTEKLIKAVKKRPALYDKTDTNYCVFGHRYTSKHWKDVCREVIKNWDRLPASDKVICDVELQKRWRNLRTCFTRELKLQSKESRANKFIARRRYTYFEDMLFLLDPNKYDISDFKLGLPEDPKTECKFVTSRDRSDSDDADPLEMEVKPGEYLEDTLEEDEIPENSFTDQHLKETEDKRDGVFQEKMIEVLEELKRDSEDEDKQFMLSLVPNLRQLDSRQKFEARIEILKVLQRITFQE